MNVKIIKQIVCFLLICACIITLSGCRKETVVSSKQREMQEWLKNANFLAEETKNELYERALQENGLVIYTNTSRLSTVIESFEREYPGLIVEMVDIRTNVIPTKLQENYDSEEYAVDLAVCTDCDGVMSKEFLEQGIIYNYVPYDIKEHIRADHCEEQLEFLGEAVMLFYNTDYNGSSPIENWWQLTESAYKEKVYLANALTSNSTYAFFNIICKNSDIMEKSYKDFYGKDLEIPEGSCAGDVFLTGLIQNAVIVNSSDEVVEAVSECDEDNQKVGIMVSSKIRKKPIGYAVAIDYTIEPFTGLYTPNSIFMVGGSKNVNTGKLFIRWLLGETDGTGEGAKPYLTDGTWSPRTDVKSQAEYDLEDLNLWQIDKDYIYEHTEEFKAFWKRLLEQYQ